MLSKGRVDVVLALPSWQHNTIKPAKFHRLFNPNLDDGAKGKGDDDDCMIEYVLWCTNITEWPSSETYVLLLFWHTFSRDSKVAIQSWYDVSISILNFLQILDKMPTVQLGNLQSPVVTFGKSTGLCVYTCMLQEQPLLPVLETDEVQQSLGGSISIATSQLQFVLFFLISPSPAHVFTHAHAHAHALYPRPQHSTNMYRCNFAMCRFCGYGCCPFHN